MKEGAWINAKTGKCAWITEHALWIQAPENGRGLGLPEESIARLSMMPWDFNGAGRRAILLEAMSQGLIRMRGHGTLCTFEFMIPTLTAIQATAAFMEEHFGPMMACRFNDLSRGESFELSYENLRRALESGQLQEPLGTFRFEPEPVAPVEDVCA